MSKLLMFSGGVESSYVLAEYLSRGEDVIPLCFNDQSVRFKNKELAAIINVGGHYRLLLKLIEAPLIPTDRLFVPGALDQFVPGYKLLMYFTAMAYAHALDIHQVLTGYTFENDHFKDEDLLIIDQSAQLYNLTYDYDVAFVHPVWPLKKAQVLRACVDLQVPLHETLSCNSELSGGVVHCGTCGCCLRRRAAFVEADIVDPSIYMVTPNV